MKLTLVCFCCAHDAGTESYTQPEARNPWLSLASSLASLSCALTLPSSARANTMVKVLATGRRVLTNLQQCLYFVVAVHIAMALLYLLGSLAGAATIIRPLDVVWLAALPVPLIGLSMLPARQETASTTEGRTPYKVLCTVGALIVVC